MLTKNIAFPQLHRAHTNKTNIFLIFNIRTVLFSSWSLPGSKLRLMSERNTGQMQKDIHFFINTGEWRLEEINVKEMVMPQIHVKKSRPWFSILIIFEMVNRCKVYRLTKPKLSWFFNLSVDYAAYIITINHSSLNA